MSDYSQDLRCEIPTPDGVDAQLPAAVERKFRRACKLLNEAIAEVQDVAPHAQYYLCSGSVCVLTGPAHEGAGTPQRHREMWSATVRDMDGGDY